jgi:hypothetical protein
MDFKVIWSDWAIADLSETVFRSHRISYDVPEELRRVDILPVWLGAREEPKF